MSNHICSILLRLPGRWLWGMVIAANLIVGAHAGEIGPVVGETAQNQAAVLQLAARIARTRDGGDKEAKRGLVSSYESVYGSIDNVPARWPALVRRALVCRQMEERACVQSSIDALNKLGGIDSLALNHLFEVSRFGMTANSVRAQLTDAKSDAKKGDAISEQEQNSPTKNVAEQVNTPKAENKSGSEKTPSSNPSLALSEEKAAPVQTSGAESIKPPMQVPVVETKPAVKVASSRTFAQKATSRLNKLGTDNQAGFFLDALFIVVVVCLVLSYFLFSALRARKIEHIERLQALQEVQQLQELRTEEKLKMDHELWSEQLKAEVALEAQKAHAEDQLRIAQLATEDAVQAEKLRSAELLKAEQVKFEQAIELEKWQAAEALKAEQLKSGEAVQAAKLRADQAIDAYDQMAARELIYAHKQNDELQEQLNKEKELREAQELKTAEALQVNEAYKQKEVQLQESVRIEQRMRASEARISAEKLKAAQQAAAALQSLLSATRESHAELQQRVAEATIRIAELGPAETNKLHVAAQHRGDSSVADGIMMAPARQTS